MPHRYPGRRPPRRNAAHALRSLRSSVLVLVLVACIFAGCSLSAQTPPQTGATPTPTSGLVPIASTTPAAALTYAAIGASDSYGVGTTHPASDNWPTVLSHQLGSSVHVLNLGIPGATVALALREEAPIAVDAAPNIVTVWLGINDLDTGTPLGRFSADLRALLGVLSTQTRASVFVGNLPDLTLVPYFQRKYDAGQLSRDVSAWNAAIAAAAKAEHATLVDIRARWGELAQHPEYIAEDGLHPSTIGAARLAAVFSQAIVPIAPCLPPCAGRL
jgi:acyl-CoA thioesterase I